MRYWYLLLPLLVLGVFFFHGLQWTARFPNDWQYYIDLNLPSYDTNYPVVEVNLPTRAWVQRGWLRPDCSDLRFTSDSNITTVFPYAIVRSFGGAHLGFQYQDNTGTSATFYLRSPVDAVVRFLFYVSPNTTFVLSVTDVNENHEIYHRAFYTDSHSVDYGVSVSIRGGHMYKVYMRYYYGGHYYKVSAPSPYYASGYVLDNISYISIDPVFGKDDNYCALYDARVLVKVPPGTKKLRVWFGAFGDVNYVAVEPYEIARTSPFPLSAGGHSFRNCESYSSCGAKSHCWGDYSGTVGIFHFQKHFGGAGDEYSSAPDCHGKHYYANDTKICTYSLDGSNNVVYARTDHSGSGCCTEFPREYGRLSLSPVSGLYMYGLIADSIRMHSDSCMEAYMSGLGGLRGDYRNYDWKKNNWYWYCVGGVCQGIHLYKMGNQYSYVLMDSNEFAPSTLAMAAGYTGSHDICGTCLGYIYFQNPRMVYLYDSDVIHFTVDANVQPEHYSVPPSVVITGPTTVYWGQPVTYSLEGNFASAEFNIEPFGHFDGPSVTVEWNLPGTYHLTAVAYNDKGTPSSVEENINVIRRTFTVSASPVGKAYTAEPFQASVTVTDVLGDPVDADVNIENCQPCHAVGGHCITTCEVNHYGDTPFAYTADANDVFYVDANGIFTLTVHRYETEFRDVRASIVGNRVAIEGVLWDLHHNAPVRGVPVSVKVYDDRNVIAQGTYYTLAGGGFRVYVASLSPGTYHVSVSFGGNCLYEPAGPASFTVTFAPPSGSSPSGGGQVELNEQNTIVIEKVSTAEPTVVAVPVSVQSSSLSVASINVAYAAGIAVFALFMLFFFSL